MLLGFSRRATWALWANAEFRFDDSETMVFIEAYARIDAWTHGRSVASPRDTPPPRPAVAMTQNDLWIAATAHVSQTTLVSTDCDFDHLNGIWINRFYVDQSRHP